MYFFIYLFFFFSKSLYNEGNINQSIKKKSLLHVQPTLWIINSKLLFYVFLIFEMI